MRPAAQPVDGLVLYKGIWTRPRTYDSQIVKESGHYLRLEPNTDDVLLDIGANIGAVSWRFLSAGVRRAVAVEPEPNNFSILQRNLAPAEGRSALVQAAVASAEGSRRLWIHTGRNKGMHSLVAGKRRRSIVVRTTTLPQLMSAHRPTLVKIDIEGGEYELAAPLGMLPAQVRGIALELHFFQSSWRSHEAPDIIAQLEAQGFSAAVAPKLTGGRPCTLGVWRR